MGVLLVRRLYELSRFFATRVWGVVQNYQQFKTIYFVGSYLA